MCVPTGDYDLRVYTLVRLCVWICKMYTHFYMYIYMYVCVCIHMCVPTGDYDLRV